MSESTDRPKLTPIRWTFAIMGDGTEHLPGIRNLVLLFRGMPFLLGLLTWWLEVKKGRV
ncbi:MAG: hypothetical protein AAF441_08250 [Pseudomonadota bacterium]